MELKTKISAEKGQQELVITREFDLPLELLYKAHVERDIIEQVMGTKVLKFEGKKHGGYEFETRNAKGNVVMQATGVFHELIINQKITRTFEMTNTPFGVQLELYAFERLTDDTSKLSIHIIYESITKRDQILKLPFAQGLNMAHNRLQDIASKLA